jgi:Flp pilus assembly protein TadG
VPRARDDRRGSATVELVAGLPLLSLCVLLGWQGLTLARETAEAEADARAAARQLVACSSSTPDYRAIDANTDATSYTIVRGTDARGAGTTTVTVTLPAVSLMPVLGAVPFATVTPNGRVSMRQESC